MSLQKQEEVLSQVEKIDRGKGKLLAKLQVPRSTYYRWRSQQRQGKLGSSSQNPKIPWNRLSSQEEAVVLANGRKHPDLSSRQLAAWITDHQDFSVSEATVYRILRRAGLVKSPELKLLPGKEYHRKTTGPHQLWATDASYFPVVGWGYYYLVTVMDDYSRFVLAWKLQTDMTADSLIEVVQLAVDATGMTEVPVEDRTRLLRDNGSGYVSRAFRDYLHLVGIHHILASPFHPQTNGKLERYHQSIKQEVNQLPYEMPADLAQAIAEFVDYYNYHRYHKALGNITPNDVLQGTRDSILAKRKEVQTQTLRRRQLHNQHIRQLENSSSLANSLR